MSQLIIRFFSADRRLQFIALLKLTGHLCVHFMRLNIHYQFAESEPIDGLRLAKTMAEDTVNTANELLQCITINATIKQPVKTQRKQAYSLPHLKSSTVPTQSTQLEPPRNKKY